MIQNRFLRRPSIRLAHQHRATSISIRHTQRLLRVFSTARLRHTSESFGLYSASKEARQIAFG